MAKAHFCLPFTPKMLKIGRKRHDKFGLCFIVFILTSFSRESAAENKASALHLYYICLITIDRSTGSLEL